MAYVVTQACVSSKLTKCVDVCPVDAFREGPEMLYIDPAVCIDCNACLSECPVRAIYPDIAVPASMQNYIELNAANAKRYPVLSESRDAEGEGNGHVNRRSTTKTTNAENIQRTRRYAIVGSGPSGFYATDEILKQTSDAAVDIFERLPTPYGLVRYGVAPDHPKIKSVTSGFEKIAQSSRVRFFGNVDIGKDLQRKDLLAHYDAVIYTTGGSNSRELDVPGVDAGNIWGAAALVGWYNGHPDCKNLSIDLTVENAVVVGIGNVALDIARILTMPIAQLEKTDIADYALEALRQSKIKEVIILARRGPVQAAFTAKELRQLLDMPDINIIVDADDLLLDAASQAALDDPLNLEAQQNIALLHEAAIRKNTGDRTIRLVFKVSPLSFGTTGECVSNINCVINTLQTNARGQIAAYASDQVRRFDAGLVVNATGYRGVPIEDLPFDRKRAVISNENGRILFAEGESAAGDTTSEKNIGREYVAGWIKRGASGVIGSNKQCAVESVNLMLQDQRIRSPIFDQNLLDISDLLKTRGCDFIDFNGWLALDAHEQTQGKLHTRPRRKEVDVVRMLEIARSTRVPEVISTDSVATEKIAPVSHTTVGRNLNTKTHFRTCSLCEAMCGIKIEYQDDKILSIAGDPDDPHSRGHICPKGYALQDLHNDPDRLRVPMKRVGEHWIPIGWDEALQEVASRLVEVQHNHGNNAVAAYWGNPTAHNLGILLTLEGFRRALKTRNLFSASSLDQMPHQFASYFMFGHSQLITIPDIDRTDYLLMLGANPAASNGSLMSAGAVLERLQSITHRGGKIVLIDPRRTETAMYASEHQFIQPGTDALFLLGLIQVIIQRRLTKPGRLIAIAKGWEQLSALIDVMPLSKIAEITGVLQRDIERIAVEFAAADKAICYGRMGMSTQEFGALNHWLMQLINILTGNLDRPGGMMFTTPAVDIVKMSGRGGFDRYRSRVRQRPEFSREFPTAIMAEEMLTPGKDQVRAFVSVAGNPVLSSPNGKQLEQGLAQLDFMVSIDFYLNETSRHAHIILPPTGPLEHEQFDLVFNLLAVRNVAKYAEPLFSPAEGAKSDWEIFSELIQRIEKLKSTKFSFLKKAKRVAISPVVDRMTPQHILDLGLRLGPYGDGMNPLTILNPFRKNGLALSTLKKHSHGMDLGSLRQSLPQRLFTRDKKIDLVPVVFVDDLKRLRQRFQENSLPPLVLIGRRDLRSNNSWMHNSFRLVKGKDRCALYINPDDAQKHGVADREQVRLISARGEVVATVKITHDIKPGVVSLPHGWGHHRDGMKIGTAQAHAGISINDLTDDLLLDDLSGNAVLNGVPVRLERLG